MKNFLFYLVIGLLFFVHNASAQGMVKKDRIGKTYLSVTGLPDYPPFSSYEFIKRESNSFFKFKSAFLQPLEKVSNQNRIKIQSENFPESQSIDVSNLIIETKDGLFDIFIGAYADTKLFRGLKLIYPSDVSNPVHIITLPSDDFQIKKSSDLMKYKGVVIKTEYFSDFVLRKIKQFNIIFVDTPYEAYEMLFTGKAQYIIGGLYYNKIMASRYGIHQYFSFSTKPLFNIPIFVSLSQMRKSFEQYAKIYHQEFSNPEFATEVKNEIIRMVNEELEKNAGIVPPSFAYHNDEQKNNLNKQEDIEKNKNKEKPVIDKTEYEKKLNKILTRF